MTTEIVLHQPDKLTVEQLSYIKDTDFVPKAYRGNLPAIMAAVVTGREYGMGDMQSLRLIDVIDGRPELRAEAKLMLARRDGHSITGTVTDDAARVTGKRADTGDTITVDYTLADAERAGLLGKANWKKHPKDMLWARAVSILCKRLFGDVVPTIPDVYENESITEAEEVDALEAATNLLPVAALEDGGVDDAHPSAPSNLEELEAIRVSESENDAFTGMTLDQVMAAPGGPKWLNWCARDGDHPESAAAAAYLKEIA